MLKQEFYSSLKDNELIKIIYLMMQNRQFYITLEGKKSRWRVQENDPAQGIVVAPILFNLHTNDQPTS